jgi:hypothetical protein
LKIDFHNANCRTRRPFLKVAPGEIRGKKFRGDSRKRIGALAPELLNS